MNTKFIYLLSIFLFLAFKSYSQNYNQIYIKDNYFYNGWQNGNSNKIEFNTPFFYTKQNDYGFKSDDYNENNLLDIKYERELYYTKSDSIKKLGLKSCKVYHLEYENGKPSDTIVGTKFLFDKNGNLNQINIISHSMGRDSYTFKFLKKDLILSERELHGLKIDPSSIDIVREESDHLDDHTVKEIEYTYDTNNNLIKFIEFIGKKSENRIVHQIDFIYENQNLVKEKVYEHGKLIYVNTHIYDSNNKLVETSQMLQGSSTVFNTKRTINYDEKGRIISIYLQRDNNTKKLKEAIVYDPFGNPMKVFYANNEAKSYSNFSGIVISYDTINNIQTVAQFTDREDSLFLEKSSSMIIKDKTEYSYNNSTKMKTAKCYNYIKRNMWQYWMYLEFDKNGLPYRKVFLDNLEEPKYEKKYIYEYYLK